MTDDITGSTVARFESTKHQATAVQVAVEEEEEAAVVVAAVIKVAGATTINRVVAVVILVEEEVAIVSFKVIMNHISSTDNDLQRAAKVAATLVVADMALQEEAKAAAGVDRAAAKVVVTNLEEVKAATNLAVAAKEAIHREVRVAAIISRVVAIRAVSSGSTRAI